VWLDEQSSEGLVRLNWSVVCLLAALQVHLSVRMDDEWPQCMVHCSMISLC